MGIVSIAEAETRKAGGTRVNLIELEIGKLAGVELDSLEFVWPLATEDSILKDARKKVHIIDGVGKCLDCDSHFKLENIYDSCPNCGSSAKEIIKGKELRVLALEVV